MADNMLKILLTAIILTCNIYADKPILEFNKYQIEYIKNNNPELLKTYNGIMKSHNNKEKKYAIFLFLSADVPIVLTDIFSRSLYRINTDEIETGVYFQGLNKSVYDYMNKATISLKKKHKEGSMDLSFMFDPDFFTENNIVQVPVMTLSLCDVGNYYPSECETQYLIHGISNVEFFIDKIIEKDEYYKNVFIKK